MNLLYSDLKLWHEASAKKWKIDQLPEKTETSLHQPKCFVICYIPHQQLLESYCSPINGVSSVPAALKDNIFIYMYELDFTILNSLFKLAVRIFCTICKNSNPILKWGSWKENSACVTGRTWRTWTKWTQGNHCNSPHKPLWEKVDS